jgi:hypothetical protein
MNHELFSYHIIDLQEYFDYVAIQNEVLKSKLSVLEDGCFCHKLHDSKRYLFKLKIEGQFIRTPKFRVTPTT